MKTIFSIGLLFAFISSCYYDKEENLYFAEFDCDTANVRYSVQVNAIISQNCLPCHNAATASGGISLETYDQLKTMVLNGRVGATIRHDVGISPMPKLSPKLSECKIKTIAIWEKAGCPNN
ncbi:MAG: hypothetical protein ACYC1Q_04805 [Bacteroidia bacterium]